MQIEIGKYYKTRDGQKVGPIRGCLDCYDYEGSVGAFTESGMSLYGCDIDLIAEWIDKPVTGTLRELNVQVGDVVKLVSGSQDGWADGNYYTIKPDGRVLNNDGSGRYWGNISDQDDDLGIRFRIISRASQQSPVINETVTTQRIVPGVYGEVKVHDPGSKYVRINIDAAMDITALREAIQTLTQIRDALTHNSAK